MIIYKNDREAHKYYDLYLKKREKLKERQAMNEPLSFPYFKSMTELYVSTEAAGKEVASSSDLNKAMNAMIEQLVATTEKQNTTVLRMLRHETLMPRMGDRAAELQEFLVASGYYDAPSKRAWARINTKKLYEWLESHGGEDSFRKFFDS